MFVRYLKHGFESFWACFREYQVIERRKQAAARGDWDDVRGLDRDLARLERMLEGMERERKERGGAGFWQERRLDALRVARAEAERDQAARPDQPDGFGDGSDLEIVP